MLKIKSHSLKNNITLTNELLVSYINNFWNEIFNDIKDTSHLMLICKVKFADNKMGYRSLGHLRKVNFDDKELFFDYLSQRLSVLNDSYMALPISISKITFSYIIKDGLASDNRALLEDLLSKDTTSHNFNNMNLPISMNPSDYGEVELQAFVQKNGERFKRFIVSKK